MLKPSFDARTWRFTGPRNQVARASESCWGIGTVIRSVSACRRWRRERQIRAHCRFRIAAIRSASTGAACRILAVEARTARAAAITQAGRRLCPTRVRLTPTLFDQLAFEVGPAPSQGAEFLEPLDADRLRAVDQQFIAVPIPFKPNLATNHRRGALKEIEHLQHVPSGRRCSNF